MSVLKWSEHLNDFILITNTSDLQIEDNSNKILQSRLLEIHNFQNEFVRLGYFMVKDPLKSC